jgi:hypothetical protein
VNYHRSGPIVELCGDHLKATEAFGFNPKIRKHQLIKILMEGLQ